MKRLLLLPLLAGFTIAPTLAFAETIFALDISNRLLRFDSATPNAVTFINGGSPITGLAPGEMLVGIDFRPVATNSAFAAKNGVLYGIGDSNRLYEIDVTTGSATDIGSGASFTLSGTAFGLDFNPVPDRFRVVSTSDQNLRINPNDGTLTATDTSLTYAAGGPNAAANPNVVGAAYTNNFGGATTTTLFGIDSNLDILVRQGGVNVPPGTPSPNAGQLATIGSLGINTTDDVGFDISGVTGIAYGSLSSVVGPLDPSSSLYTINLASGAANLVGSIGPSGGVGAFVTRDIAASVGIAVPEPTSFGLLTLGIAALAGGKFVRRA